MFEVRRSLERSSQNGRLDGRGSKIDEEMWRKKSSKEWQETACSWATSSSAVAAAAAVVVGAVAVAVRTLVAVLRGSGLAMSSS